MNFVEQLISMFVALRSSIMNFSVNFKIILQLCTKECSIKHNFEYTSSQISSVRKKAQHQHKVVLERKQVNVLLKSSTNKQTNPNRWKTGGGGGGYVCVCVFCTYWRIQLKIDLVHEWIQDLNFKYKLHFREDLGGDVLMRFFEILFITNAKPSLHSFP